VKFTRVTLHFYQRKEFWPGVSRFHPEHAFRQHSWIRGKLFIDLFLPRWRRPPRKKLAPSLSVSLAPHERKKERTKSTWHSKSKLYSLHKYGLLRGRERGKERWGGEGWEGHSKVWRRRQSEQIALIGRLETKLRGNVNLEESLCNGTWGDPQGRGSIQYTVKMFLAKVLNSEKAA